MDGTISSVGAHPSRQPAAHFQVGVGVEADSIHSGLFEQILSLPIAFTSVEKPYESPPPKPAEETSQTEPKEQSDTEPNSERDTGSDADEASNPAAAAIAQQTDPLLHTAAAQTAPQEQPADTPVETATKLQQDQAEPSDGRPAFQVADTQPEPTTDITAADRTESIDTEKADAVETVVSTSRPAEQTQASSPEAEVVETPVTREVKTDSEKQSTAPAEVETQSQPLSASDVDRSADQESDSTQQSSSDGPVVESQQPSDDRQDQGRNDRREKWYERGGKETSAGQAASSSGPSDARQSPPDAPGSPERTGNSQPSQAPTPGPTQGEPIGTAPTQTPESLQSIAVAATEAIVAAPTQTSDTRATRIAETTQAALGSPSASKSPGTKTPETTATGAGNATSEAGDLSQQERVRLVQRVSRSFARLGPTGGQINLRLHPPQLGSLNVQVRLEGRDMTAKLSTETAAARDVILESLPVLRSRLAEQGFEVSQFQVEVAENGNDATRGDQGQNMFSRGDRDSRQSHPGYRHDTLATQNQTGGQDLPVERSELAWQTSTGIDLHA